ncbi:glycosyl hydrolase family 18 protein [Dactylosporangium sp. NPDC049140]|uniref:glycosyl hydrolase family 18 protein n=1 Tax=Dactylosporangium sp. NPDC049140 TaxID=3155647 RepID=UPI0033DDBD23
MTDTSRPLRVGVIATALLSLATLGVVVAMTSAAGPASAASALAVTGYAESGGATTAAEIDASAAAMTTVGVDGININSAGNSAPAPDSTTITLMNKAHADNLRAEFLVGNYSASLGDFDPTALDKLLSSSSNISKLVTSLVSDVNSQGWDGVTVDFELIPSNDKQGLVNFVKALKAALPAGKTVSVDVTAFTNAADYPANGYDLAALGNAADRIVLMAYDEHGPTWNGVGPIGGLPWQESCLKLLLANVPAAKVDLGVAGYGYTWPTSGTGVQVTDAQARQMVQRDGSTATWDSTQGEWTVTLKNGTVMWWSDAKSWPLRVTLAQKYSLHGMALWALDISDPIPVTSQTNDFSIAASPSAATVTAGSSATSTISAAVTSGSAQTVALTSSGAPAGVTVSFAPTSIGTGSSSTMTIATSSSVASGTYPITVTGTAASGQHTTTYTLTVGGTGGTSTAYEAEASSSTLAGGAAIVTCSACSGGARVGYLGGTGTLKMQNITVAAAGTYTVTVAYTNGTTSSLKIMLSVNGGTAVTLTGAPTANWNTPATATVTLTLAAGSNSILFSNARATGDVPDIDKITVPANYK